MIVRYTWEYIFSLDGFNLQRVGRFRFSAHYSSFIRSYKNLRIYKPLIVICDACMFRYKKNNEVSITITSPKFNVCTRSSVYHHKIMHTVVSIIIMIYNNGLLLRKRIICRRKLVRRIYEHILFNKSYKYVWCTVRCKNECTIMFYDCCFARKTKLPKVRLVMYIFINNTFILCMYVLLLLLSIRRRRIIYGHLFESRSIRHRFIITDHQTSFRYQIFVLRWIRNRCASVSRSPRRRNLLLYIFIEIRKYSKPFTQIFFYCFLFYRICLERKSWTRVGICIVWPHTKIIL